MCHIVSYRTVLWHIIPLYYDIVPCRIILYLTALYCIVRTILYYMLLCPIVSYCIIVYQIVLLHSIQYHILSRTAVSYRIASHRVVTTVPSCVVWYCVLLRHIIPNHIVEKLWQFSQWIILFFCVTFKELFCYISSHYAILRFTATVWSFIFNKLI